MANQEVILEDRSEEFKIRTNNRGFDGFSKDTEGKWRGPFCFIQAADTQFGMIDGYVNNMPKETRSWDEEIRLTQEAIKSANAMQPAPKFFIVCGDLVDAMPGDTYKDPQQRDLKSVFATLRPDIPLVCVCGNHDIGNTPTHKAVQEYRKNFGDDFFSFWVGGVKFIVINSQYYEDSSQVPDLKADQDAWLDAELLDAQSPRCQHLVVFQHIPWFIENPDEPKQYFNVESTLRKQMLDKFRDAGVRYIFCGHYHRNAGGFYGDLELIVTSAIGAQLGDEKSGLRIVSVKEQCITHRYYPVEDVPTVIEL